MQGPLLRVIAVTIGLILCPREEPGVEDWADVADGMEAHEGLLNEARKPNAEIPFNNEVPQTDTKAKALVNTEKPSESTTSSNAPHTLLSSEDLPLVYSEGKVENAYVESKDSGNSHFIAEPDANLPQGVQVESDALHHQNTSPADHTEGPAELRREEHVAADRVPSHRVAHENRAHIRTSGALIDPSRSSTQGEGQRVLVHQLSKPPQRDSVERGQEKDYLGYIWNIFSAISLVHFLRKYLKRYSLKKVVEDWIQSNSAPPVERISGRVPLPDSETLHLFHARFVKMSHAKIGRAHV